MTENVSLNADRELYRESTRPAGIGEYYENSVHVTQDGRIGMNVAGCVVTQPIAEWHRQALQFGPLVDRGEWTDGYHTFNELYEYRKAYNAALFNEWSASGLYDVHKSLRHSDGQYCFGGGWFIVVAQLPTGQISNHYAETDWDLFRIPARHHAAPYDGHTADEALERLKAHL